MAYDKVIDSEQFNSNLQSVANSIRENIGANGQLEFPDGFVAAIAKDKTKDFEALIEGCVQIGGEGTGVFEGGLETLESENITRIGHYSLFENHSIKHMILPNLQRVESHGCCYCKELEVADIGATYLSINAFAGCDKLKTLVLRADSVCELYSYAAFGSSPFGNDGSGGVAYVPKNLLEAYKTTNYWYSLYTWGTCRFEPIEGSIYDNELKAFKEAVNNLPAEPSATEECKKAVAHAAIAYSTLTVQEQQDAAAAEIEYYQDFRARWIEISEATVIETANAIGTVTNTPECLAKIEAAEAAIASLGTDSLTKLADYVSIVEAARQQYNEYQNTI